MDIATLREKSDADLQAELVKLSHSQFDLRMQLRTGQLARNHELRVTRRTIARIKTLLNERHSKKAK